MFKSNSAILNTLLTLLNERLFDDGATRATWVREKVLHVSPFNVPPDGDARWREFFPNGTAPLRNTMCFRCGDAGLARACA